MKKFNNIYVDFYILKNILIKKFLYLSKKNEITCHPYTILIIYLYNITN